MHYRDLRDRDLTDWKNLIIWMINFMVYVKYIILELIIQKK
jgi:hypothetical protein